MNLPTIALTWETWISHGPLPSVANCDFVPRNCMEFLHLSMHLCMHFTKCMHLGNCIQHLARKLGFPIMKAKTPARIPNQFTTPKTCSQDMITVGCNL